ncbi:hypothetical protein LXA43DRAFT_1088487 [Ganoderma leucocontextum]|nr:hypothetical protein LXA43DRAFT_1088487 [Ganoderma leucocontextum]
MENVPPSSTDPDDELPTLDNLSRPKCNVRAARQKRSPAKLNTRSNADLEDEDSQLESGLLTPPPSQTLEEDLDPSRMLFSPPPEEVLRQGRTSATRARSAPIQQPFTPSLLADPPPQSTALFKRKRNAHNRSSSHTAVDSIAEEASSSSILVTEATPNPKPRKQTKRGSPSGRSTVHEEPTTPTRTASQQQSESPTKRALLLSPHHTNPDADFIPPLPVISRQTLSSRRRSATPIPPYEPPREQFTPPREIIHTPPRATVSPERMSKSSKRKSTATKKQKKLVLTIKKEPPEIDLSLPPPPPSPSDDPLLLKGLPRRPRPSKLSSGADPEALDTPASTHARRTPSIASSSVSPPGEARVTRLPNLNSSMDISMQNDDDDLDDSFVNAPPLFDLTNAQEDPGAWDDVDEGSDSDFDQTGEYTGRFKVLTVPTKADPPSSCTRSRQDAWGNPSSPFPGRRRSLPSSSSPPLKAVADGEEGAQSESLDEDDVFFLDTPANDNTDVTVREEFEEGSSRDTIDGLAGLDADLSMHDVPQADYDSSQEEHDTSQEQSHEKSPSPLPIVDAPEEDHEHEQDSAEHHERHVRFTASGESLEDVSMEIDDEDDSQDAPPLDADLSYESILHDPDEDREDSPVAEAPYDSDSSDEETVDRELSREPGQFSDEEDEGHDTRAKPPAIPTPPRAAHTPARSVSPNGSTRPKGFLSITSPLRRQKSPQTQGFQVRDALPMPSIEAVFATPASAPTRDVDDDGHIPQPSGSRLEAGMNGQVETEHQMEDDQPEEQIATDAEDDSGDESEELDDGVVKITSDDPRVAARAAAILKMHDYDFIIRDTSRKRRYSDLDSALRNVRRRSTIEGGIAKRGTPRRRTLGGIVGDQVFIPGSPMMTVPELLKQAERTVEQRERSILHTPSRDPAGESASFRLPLPVDTPTFETPGPEERMHARPMFNASGPRAWKKDDWKLLDACFTDERLSIGSHKRLGEATLAHVDDVDLDNVVTGSWTTRVASLLRSAGQAGRGEHDLLRRTYALQKKQRAGKGAPPTPSSRFGSVALSEVPDFTPLPSRYSSVQPGFDRWGSTNGVGSSKPAVPATLLAPRYSHLLDEAVAISRNEFTTPTASHTQPVEYRSASVPVPETRDVSLPPQSPATALRSESEAPMVSVEEKDISMSMPPPPLPVPRSITSRMKGFFFSYLPKATKSNQLKRPAARAHPGLPIPPPEVFQKSRTVATPVSKPAPKPVPPKDLVNLQHAPLPPSKIPRPSKQQPKRLVELQPAPLPEPRQASSLGRGSVGSRRSSNGSVKDLVKGFEDLEKMHAKERQEEITRLRRVRSVGEWAAATGNARGQGQGQQSRRLGWKP